MPSHKRNPAAPAGTSGRSPRRRRAASGHLIGYSRVSTDDQNLALQLDALKQAGCRRVFRDVGSGSLSHRPELDACLQFLTAGDTLVVWRLDRLGRGLKHLIEAIENLHDREIGFRSLTEQIDTTTSAGRLQFHIFGALAEFERDAARGISLVMPRGRLCRVAHDRLTVFPPDAPLGNGGCRHNHRLARKASRLSGA